MCRLVPITVFQCNKCKALIKEKEILWLPNEKVKKSWFLGFRIVCPICGNVIVSLEEKYSPVPYGKSTPIHDSNDLEPSYLYIMRLIGGKVVSVEFIFEN